MGLATFGASLLSLSTKRYIKVHAAELGKFVNAALETYDEILRSSLSLCCCYMGGSMSTDRLVGRQETLLDSTWYVSISERKFYGFVLK